MSTLDEVKTWLAEQLPALIEKYDVPGAAVAVLAGGEVVDAAAGRAQQGDRRRGDAPTRSSRSARSPSSGRARWSCSSSTRACSTSTRRSAPTCPSSRSRDEAAAAQITTRQLLNHTSGFEGDIFTDTGLGDDCVEKYVGVLARGPPAVPARRAVLLQQRRLLRARPAGRGAAREAVRRVPARAPRSRRSGSPTPRPARTRRSCSAPRSATSSSSPAPASSPRRSGRWRARTPRPARCSRCARATCSTFAEMHLDDGKAADGTQVLAPGTAARMHEPRGRPALPRPDGRLVGPRLGALRHPRRRDHRPRRQHHRPERRSCASSPRPGVAVALLTNGGDVISLYHDVVGHVLERAHRRRRCPPLPTPPRRPGAHRRRAGTSAPTPPRSPT